jgi:hypothetical protein
MVLNKDFKEFIQLLNENNVRYLIVGGYAVGFHGYPRYTKDLDIWIWLAQENAQNILKALHQFGFGSLGLKPEDFLADGNFVQLGYPPNRIDILNSLSGVDFETCYASRVEATIDDISIKFIDVENLKRNKIASGRNQDLGDVDNLTSNITK